MRLILLSWVIFTYIVFEDLKKSIVRFECCNYYRQVVLWLHFRNYLLSSSFLYLFISMLYSSCRPFCPSFLPLSFSTFLSNTLFLYPLSLALFFFFFFLFHIFPSLFLPVLSGWIIQLDNLNVILSLKYLYWTISNLSRRFIWLTLQIREWALCQEVRTLWTNHFHITFFPYAFVSLSICNLLNCFLFLFCPDLTWLDSI